MIKRSIRSGATVLDQQIELVAKLFNDPFELPTTLGRWSVRRRRWRLTKGVQRREDL